MTTPRPVPFDLAPDADLVERYAHAYLDSHHRGYDTPEFRALRGQVAPRDVLASMRITHPDRYLGHPLADQGITDRHKECRDAVRAADDAAEWRAFDELRVILDGPTP